MKSIFDEKIKGYTKESYELEEQEKKAVWGKTGNMDRMLSDVSAEEQPELLKYVESYRKSKEEKQIASKKRQKKHEAELEEAEEERAKKNLRRIAMENARYYKKPPQIEGAVATSSGFMSKSEYYKKLNITNS